jgi:micrococcal nuclease
MNKKRIFLIVAIIVVIIAGELFLRNRQKTQYSSQILRDATTSAVIQSNSETAIVARVIDGDTIELTDKRRVRYIGIDTPEIADPGKPTECYGSQAKDENKRLVGGKTVRLEKDVTETDQYGRLLRYVFVGDVLVNNTLIQNGFARVTTFPPDVKYKDQFLASQKQAKEYTRGLWKYCPVQ